MPGASNAVDVPSFFPHEKSGGQLMPRSRSARGHLALSSDLKERLSSLREDIVEALSDARNVSELGGRIPPPNRLIDKIPGFENKAWGVLQKKSANQSKGAKPRRTVGNIVRSLGSADISGRLRQEPFAGLNSFRHWWGVQVRSEEWKSLRSDLLHALGIRDLSDDIELRLTEEEARAAPVEIDPSLPRQQRWQHAFRAFRQENREYIGSVEKIVGEYIHISPKAAASLTPESVRDRVRFGRLRIYEVCDSTADFEMGSLGSPSGGTNPYTGFVTCHSGAFFLLGFDQRLFEKIMYSVLRRPSPALGRSGVRLLGMHVGTLPGGLENGRGFAKRMVLVDETSWTTLWKGGEHLREDVIEWVLGDGPGFVLELLVPRGEEE